MRDLKVPGAAESILERHPCPVAVTNYSICREDLGRVASNCGAYKAINSGKHISIATSCLELCDEAVEVQCGLEPHIPVDPIVDALEKRGLGRGDS